MKRFCYTLIFLLTIFASCSSFDSNKYNHKLIQGNWMQVELRYPHPMVDSIVIELLDGQQSNLTFRGDSCLEQLYQIEDSTYYTFEIKDYVMQLKGNSIDTKYLEVNKLTEDSLVLRKNDTYWKYKKRESKKI